MSKTTTFQNCIRCTICVENCSVFGINPLFPGPKQAGPDAQRFRLDGEEAVDEWVKYCCQCKRCELSCPYGVDVSEIILRAQIRCREEKGGTLSSTIFTHNFFAGEIASFTAPLFNKIAASSWGRKAANRAGISTYIPFPEFRFFSFRRGLPSRLLRFGRRKKGVVFFHGCYLNYNRPDISKKIRRLLGAFGLDIAVPSQTCCGLPALGNGNLKAARMYAQRNVECLSPYIDAGYDVVYACASCGLSLTHEYPGILDIPGGKKIAENSYNVNEYLLNLLEGREVTLEFGRVERKLAYHVPCHLRAIGIGYPAVRVFSQIPGLEYTVIDDQCCGMAGSYGFKKENQETSRAIGEKATHAVKQTGAECVVADCGACRMQLGHMTGLPALDPVEIITESLQNGGGIPAPASGLLFRELKQIKKKIRDSL